MSSIAVFCRPAGGDREADEGEGGGPAAGGEGEHGPPEAGEAAGGGAGGAGQQGDRAGAKPEHGERRPPAAGPSSGETAGEEPEVPRCESQRMTASVTWLYSIFKMMFTLMSVTEVYIYF